jgi:hypothetical protein
VKGKMLKRLPVKPYKLTSFKQRELISLLSELKDQTLKEPYTKKSSTIVDCCLFLIETLES